MLAFLWYKRPLVESAGWEGNARTKDGESLNVSIYHRLGRKEDLFVAVENAEGNSTWFVVQSDRESEYGPSISNTRMESVPYFHYNHDRNYGVALNDKGNNGWTIDWEEDSLRFGNRSFQVVIRER